MLTETDATDNQTSAPSKPQLQDQYRCRLSTEQDDLLGEQAAVDVLQAIWLLNCGLLVERRTLKMRWLQELNTRTGLSGRAMESDNSGNMAIARLRGLETPQIVLRKLR